MEGLRARLIATPHGRDLALDLEIENVSDVGNPMEIWWDDLDGILRLSLDTDAGAVATAGIGGSHASPPPYWLMLPVSSKLTISITPNAYEDVSGTRTMFRPLTFQGWDMPAGKLYLHGELAPPAPTDRDGRRPWLGKISLPRIELPARP